jgi:aspartyl/glutamyl-tRNA(Asn/Gln) amidotransferase C subunit
MKTEIDVQKIAKLARLKLDKDEEKELRDKFAEIINYVGSISEVEIGEQTREKDESLQKIYHEDRQVKSEVSPEQFSAHVENLFFKVPKVIE